MAAEQPDAFLKAEEEAIRLVELLEQLRNEIISYSEAHDTLDVAADAVGKLATRCADIVEQVGGLAEVLRTIGTPELLRRLQEVNGHISTLRTDLDGAQQSIIAAQKAGVDRLQTLIGDKLDWTANVASSIADFRNRLDIITAKLQKTDEDFRTLQMDLDGAQQVGGGPLG